jgi:hypothetical protein
VPEIELSQIQYQLKRLSNARIALFGADVHRFALNLPLTEGEVLAFERLHNILLPSDYRYFITHIANGGAGPYYGVFPLGQMDGTGERLNSWREKNGFVGVLSEPFPLLDAWNDLAPRPSEELIDSDPEEYDRQLAAFDRVYWDTARVNGAFPICHLGCALRIWLVVTGEEAGHLWLDRRADDNGLFPVVLKNNLRAIFSSWYHEWLNDAFRLLQQTKT